MKTKLCGLALLALFLSVGAQAQSQPDVHKAKIRPAPEERTAQKLDRKAQIANMTPTERRAFKQAHHNQRQNRLNAMTPKQRAKTVERQRVRKETRRTGK